MFLHDNSDNNNNNNNINLIQFHLKCFPVGDGVQLAAILGFSPVIY